MKSALTTTEILAKIGREHELAELEYEDAGVKIHLVFDPPEEKLLALGANPGCYPLALPSAPTIPTLPIKNEPTDLDKGDRVCSPLAGVFYAAPRPDAEPFVREGQAVGIGQTLCIVEAMKLMNEITAERSCKIVKILVGNGEPVEDGQALFSIE